MKRSASVDEKIGARMRERRTKLGITIEQFAVELDETISQVERWELGLARVGADKLLKISKLMDVSPVSLFPTYRTDGHSDLLSDEAPVETHQLIETFASIRNPTLRKAVIDLVEGMAKSTVYSGSRH
jgi:transcriptional regulator with XRE-family HTH domain